MGNPLGEEGLYEFHVLTSYICYCYFIIIIISLSSSFSVFLSIVFESKLWALGVTREEVTSATIRSLVCGLFQAMWFSWFYWLLYVLPGILLVALSSPFFQLSGTALQRSFGSVSVFISHIQFPDLWTSLWMLWKYFCHLELWCHKAYISFL